MKTAERIPALLKRAERRKRLGGQYFVGKSIYWPVSRVEARRLLIEEFGPEQRLPKVGCEVAFPDTVYMKRDGHWVLSNHSGNYELTFYEEETQP